MGTLKKDMNQLIFAAMEEIAPLLFFSKNGFDIELKTKAVIPLNKKTKPNQTKTNKTKHTHMHTYILWLDSIPGVMVTVVENGHSDTSSNPRRDCLHLT